jgi:superfamily II DNA or RNA helicase
VTRTYGTLTYDPGVVGRGVWRVAGEPHVIIRLKRLFARARVSKVGEVALADTPEVARDLEWILDRYPLVVDDDTAKRLEGRADEQREREHLVDTILSGGQVSMGALGEPARPPRGYQTVAANLCIASGRLLLLDDLGLGKSNSGLMVFAAPDAIPAVVVTLTHLPPQWKSEVAKTWPLLRVHIATSGTAYNPAKKREMRGHDPDVLILNYSKLDGWAEYLAGWARTVIFDEMQELRRHQSNKYDAARRVAEACRYRMGLTATPVYNYGGEVYNLVSVLDDDVLGTRDEFAREWGVGSSGDHLTVASPAALGGYLRDQGIMLRRTRAEVGRELPEVIRVHQHVPANADVIADLAGDAVALAEAILNEDTSSKDRFLMSGDLDWRLRQATGIAKAPYVAEFVRLLCETDEQVVLFGWHRAVYDLWEDKLADLRPVFYTGEESPRQKQRSAQEFLDGTSRVLVMSLRAGAGLDGLQEVAHIGVFGELDWSPGVHSQCIGRLHRDGQDEPVVAYFLVSDEGSDPIVADVLGLKRAQSEPIVDPQGALFQEADPSGERVRMLAEEVLRRAGKLPLAP